MNGLIAKYHETDKDAVEHRKERDKLLQKLSQQSLQLEEAQREVRILRMKQATTATREEESINLSSRVARVDDYELRMVVSSLQQ